MRWTRKRSFSSGRNAIICKGRAQGSFLVNRHQGSLSLICLLLPAPFVRAVWKHSALWDDCLHRLFLRRKTYPSFCSCFHKRCPLFCASAASPLPVGPGSFLNFPHFRNATVYWLPSPFLCAFLTFPLRGPTFHAHHTDVAVSLGSHHLPTDPRSVSSTPGCCHRVRHSATLLCQARGKPATHRVQALEPQWPHSISETH